MDAVGWPAGKMTTVLAEGMEKLALPHDKLTLEKLIDFLRLLNKWNKVYNLTAIRDLGQMVSGHLLDSLVVYPYVQGPTVIDVGTGGGLPGVPLALVCPEKHFVLLDGNAKKTRFVRQAVIELALDNVTVVHARVERFKVEERFDTVITRAFSALPEMLAQTKHLLKPGGRLMALKGRIPTEEMRCISKLQWAIIPLSVPGMQAERHLVCLSPAISQG